MARLGLIGFCLGAFLSIAPPLLAADQDEPRVRMMQIGAETLLRDLKAVMSLTSPTEQEQTQVIENYLDAFLVGVNRTRLVRMDLIFGDGPVRYRPSIPIEDERAFRFDNLKPNGIEKKRQFSSALFSTKGVFEGWMRISDDYATFTELEDDLPKDKIPPDQAVLHLAKPGYNAAVELINTPEGIAPREKSYHSPKGLRQELLSTLVKTKTETQDTYDLRALAFKHQMDDLERIYVQARHSLLGAKFNPDRKTGALEFLLEPLPGTPLATSIDLLNQAPPRFANVPKAPKSIMSIRARIPLDEMRQRHLTETIQLLRRIAHNDAKANTKKTPAQKAATNQVTDLGFDFLLKTINAGMADGFFEAHPEADGTHTAIGAFQAVDGNAALELLKLLQKTRAGQKVTFDVAEEGGIKIHTFLIGEEQYPGFREFYGGPEIHVGLSQEAVWFGAGANALSELKTAIQQVAKPNAGKATDPFFSMSGRTAPWLKMEEQRAGGVGNEEFQKYRRLMIEAGEPGDDFFAFSLARMGENLIGNGSVEPGLLRFLGKYLADFSVNNLDE